ncbi:MAG: NAD(P)-binding protein [Actinomycetaceae bacterium]|nr:NAD(P)-binding protein [Actinomycetaceae bacterium]MDY6083149.1 NAD(P)-binding protein [Actinomycetaceae bacterium]
MTDIAESMPFAITLPVGSSLQDLTGSWRTERPVYMHMLPPCNKACPAGENIQEWLSLAEEHDYEGAWREMMVNNPFPATMGRVCYHDCEVECNRAKIDEAVGINSIERFIGDQALEKGWKVDPVNPASGKTVLVVGGGPSGLSAAYHLARLGHTVTVVDSGEELGGMMRYGIPSYRLPRNILDAEIKRIEDMGVTMKPNTTVEDLNAELDKYDAVFIAVGAQVGKHLDIPAATASHVVDAVQMLHEVQEDKQNESVEKPLLGRRVVVYGGGNTAIDAARTAQRLGAHDPVIVYRRTQQQMPAHQSEYEEATEEGIKVKWLSTIDSIGESEIQIEKMELDENGYPQPTGEYETLAADDVVMAVGQVSDLGLLNGVDGIEIEKGVVKVDTSMMTGHKGLFAGGDMVPTPDKNVTVAIGHGKKAARNIDAYLRGSEYRPEPKHPDAAVSRLTTWYYSDAPLQVRGKLEEARRRDTFDEVVRGLDEDSAVFEARRCMSCGNCFGCDNCFAVCPDNAVIKIEPGTYEFNYDYCKGCGVCYQECPCGCIQMVPEQI